MPGSKFMATIAQIDAQLSQLSTPGMDPIFREPRVGVDPNTNERVLGRKESTVRLPCQIQPQTYQQLAQTATGITPKTALKLLFHYEDFEERGMVDLKRRNTPIRPTDRLVEISSYETGERLLYFAYPPGVFATECLVTGFQDGYANLLTVTFGDRAQGKPMG